MQTFYFTRGFFPSRMRGLAAALVLLGAAPAALAQSTTLPGPAGSGAFGSAVTVLPNGNFVVTDPLFDAGAAADVGAVYLYNGTTNAVISTLTGSTAGDQVGSGGVVTLANGNFVVRSPDWGNGAAAPRAGAVTWGSATAGASGAVSAANSLVGSTANDQVSADGLTPLRNGSYVVASSQWDNGAATNAGAATWQPGNGPAGGAVSTANSLVGTQAGDQVAFYAVNALPNGNYVVQSAFWANGAATEAGAVTWGSGTTGISGPVSAANSLVGTQQDDFVGSYNFTVLPSGNYLVYADHWKNGSVPSAGAVTWGSGTGGTVGPVSAANSLVGTTAYDNVGFWEATVLPNGNYLLLNDGWHNSSGSVFSAGAVTWGNGLTGTSGAVSAANSLVGDGVYNLSIGSDDFVLLPSGDYLVVTPRWSSAALNQAGAVTWGSGTGPTAGVVGPANSLVGTHNLDRVGEGGVVGLAGGQYVVSSPSWDNGGTADVGAVTWLAGGQASVSGVVSAANSLVGTTAGDQVGYSGVVALPNGHYVVGSMYWANGAAAEAGAVTWRNGTVPAGGAVVSAANSLVGSTAGDQLSNHGLKVLPSGHYVVNSPSWSNGGVPHAGAVTWLPGGSPTSGVVSAANSLVGSTADDYVGFETTLLRNGDYLVNSGLWNAPGAPQAGAFTWGSGASGIRGPVSLANSLVGSHPNDVGNSIVTSLPDGKYILWSSDWDNGPTANAGAITLGRGAAGPFGFISACTSAVGTVAGGGIDLAAAYHAPADQLIVGLPKDNKVVRGDGPPAAPTGAASQVFGPGATVANLAATGTAVRWYAAASGGAALPAGTPLVGTATYYASQTLNGCESVARLAVQASVPLPVELTEFTATAEGNMAVRLTWATASEKNSQAFEVERSVDGETFASIGTVAAAGTSTSPRTYGLLDAKLPAGATVLYYRLKQLDADGSFSYSPVRPVTLTGATAGLALYPNPAPSGTATLTGVLPGTVVTVLDPLGRPVTSATADAAGTAALVPPAGLPAGVYVVRVDGKALRLTVE
ncbi:T9SS type A sorting domain-containing protein [Hymenobacter negativus]|uniref:T9SS type A sorting domain-containing protein n=1 Tax=Hymenobacter negativus TaxID=2795026 RepID=A0ABS3Q9L8_9BACT|nr:T9SS type A sorting domain-containing protein [Hymenobacter negativus]MBO2007713.1 T9SS type A sorting domain-containing protein [Hymenobacter negativus]